MVCVEGAGLLYKSGHVLGLEMGHEIRGNTTYSETVMLLKSIIYSHYMVVITGKLFQ